MTDQIPAWLAIVATQKHRLLLFLIDWFTMCLTIVSLLTRMSDDLFRVSGNDHYQFGCWMDNGQSNHAMPGHLPLHFRFLISDSVWTHKRMHTHIHCVCIHSLIHTHILTLLKWLRESGLTRHISVTRQTPVSSTPWFFSLSSCLMVGTYTSIRSGTLRTIRTAHNAAYKQVCEAVAQW